MLHVLSVFCSKFLPSAVFSPHLTYDTVGEVLLFGTCRCTRLFFFFTGLYRYGCWTQLLYIIITLIVNGMSISFCWGYLMLIKKLCVQAHFAERKFKTWIFYETCLVWLDDCDQVLRAAAPNSAKPPAIPSWNFWRPVLKMDGILIPR